MFAVLAARPGISHGRHAREDFETDRARLMAFEQFSDLEEEEYIGAMRNTLGDRQRIHENTIARVYRLGETADREYRRLDYSCTAFVIGAMLIVGALLVLEWMKWSQASPLG